KIAGWIKISDEMAEHLPFMVTEINNRLLYQLLMFEEHALLNGTGTGSSITGILNREGLQTETSGGARDDSHALYRALTKGQLAAGMIADGMVVGRTDQRALRWSGDVNGRCLDGGPFLGQYGQGGFSAQPPVQRQTPISTTGTPQGTALVGAGKQAAPEHRMG